MYASYTYASMHIRIRIRTHTYASMHACTHVDGQVQELADTHAMHAHVGDEFSKIMYV